MARCIRAWKGFAPFLLAKKIIVRYTYWRILLVYGKMTDGNWENGF